MQRASLLKETEKLVAETKERWKAALDSTPAVSVPVVIDGKETWKNVIYRMRPGPQTIDGHAMSAHYEALRKKAVAAGLDGAGLVPAAAAFVRKGMPSRPILLKGLMPKEAPKKGTVAEGDEVVEERE